MVIFKINRTIKIPDFVRVVGNLNLFINALTERYWALGHAHSKRADYFDYDIQWTLEKCFIAECSAYHALFGKIDNLIHPAPPKELDIKCPFCRSTFDRIRNNRLTISKKGNFRSS